MTLKLMYRSASLSPCGRYRWSLERVWDKRHPLLCWVMLNPSTADGEKDDPTVTRVIAFSRREMYGGCIILNLMAWRATNPLNLPMLTEAVGGLNDDTILRKVKGQDVIAAWGNLSPNLVWKARANTLLRKIKSFARSIRCLGRTKDGFPRHPLFVGSQTPLEYFGR